MSGLGMTKRCQNQWVARALKYQDSCPLAIRHLVRVSAAWPACRPRFSWLSSFLPWHFRHRMQVRLESRRVDTAVSGKSPGVTLPSALVALG